MTDTIKANKLARVLSDRRLKYTCLLVKKDGTTYEFQADNQPKVEFNAVTRSALLVYGGYDASAICSWDEVSVFLCDPNPEADTENKT